MIKLNQLSSIPKARKKKKRLGCGESSGRGKTSGKGHKGQKSRSGFSNSPSFEGGQMPLYRRLPRRGFNNVNFQIKFAIVNLSQLEKVFSDKEVITEEELRSKGIISGKYDAIKILGNGSLTKNFTIFADVFSLSARGKIEALGGKCELAK